MTVYCYLSLNKTVIYLRGKHAEAERLRDQLYNFYQAVAEKAIDLAE